MKILDRLFYLIKIRGEIEKMNVKEKIKKNRLTQWEVAEVMGISEFTLSRYLRRPMQLDDDKINKIEKAIKELTNK